MIDRRDTVNRRPGWFGCILLVAALVPLAVWASGGRLDNNGGHFDRKSNAYHCHSADCKLPGKDKQRNRAVNTTAGTIATRVAKAAKITRLGGNDSKPYNRKDWSLWTDDDRDCQNTRQEVLIASSKGPVTFKKGKRCTVSTGQWFDEYTGRTFTLASDVDIDHIVPLAHAYRNGAASWTRSQKRAFANDPVNLIVVDDGTNQSKSDQEPHEWMPPRKAYACDYLKRWNAVKAKYGLSASSEEKQFISMSLSTCNRYALKSN